MRVLSGCLFCFLSISIAAQTTTSTPELDFRIKKHYSDAQIAEITLKHPAKIKQLNFYFQKSYVILGPKKCETIDLEKFDVMDYEKYRKMDERVIVGLSREGHILELLSIKELQEIYKDL